VNIPFPGFVLLIICTFVSEWFQCIYWFHCFLSLQDVIHCDVGRYCLLLESMLRYIHLFHFGCCVFICWEVHFRRFKLLIKSCWQLIQLCLSVFCVIQDAFQDMFDTFCHLKVCVHTFVLAAFVPLSKDSHLCSMLAVLSKDFPTPLLPPLLHLGSFSTYQFPFGVKLILNLSKIFDDMFVFRQKSINNMGISCEIFTIRAAPTQEI